MSDKLAYGFWLTHTPSVVVFDRSYRPFLVVDKDGDPMDCEPHWVDEIALQVFLWTDDTPADFRDQISASFLKIMREAVYGP